MMNIVTPYLVRVHHIPPTSVVIQRLFQQLEVYLYQKYMTPLSYLQLYRTRRELKLSSIDSISIEERQSDSSCDR